MQLLEAEELEGLLYAELQRTPKHGAQFCAAVRTILHRETQCVPPGMHPYYPRHPCHAPSLLPKSLRMARAAGIANSHCAPYNSRCPDHCRIPEHTLITF